MTAKYTERQGEIVLDGVRYRLARGTRVRSTLAANFAPKQVIGPDDMNAHEGVSYLRWDDWTEGIGLEEFFQAGGPAPKRAWWSTCDLSHAHHLVLGPLAFQTADFSNTSQIIFSNDQFSPGGAIATFENNVYGAFIDPDDSSNVNIYKYDDSTDDWGSSLHTISTSATARAAQSVITGKVGGTDYIVFASLVGYAYSSDGSSWTNSSENVAYMATFDNRLWGATDQGDVWYATTPGTETAVASIPVTPIANVAVGVGGLVSGLFVAHAPNGEEALYASTGEGLFIYDIENDRWIKTGVVFPPARFNGLNANVWNADIYLPSGMGLYRAVINSQQTTVIPMGPDRDHGLPEKQQSAIVTVKPALNFLVAALAADAWDLRDFVSGSTSARPPLLAWNGRGWQVIWVSDEDGENLRWVALGRAYAEYRLWFSTYARGSSNKQRVYYIQLPPQALNPVEVTNRDYATSGLHITPWFAAGEDVVGIAVEFLVEVNGASNDETVKVEYATDGSSTWNNFVDANGSANNTITSDGTTTLKFRDGSDNPTGISFRAIRFRLTLSRGATTTNTPDVRSLTLQFLKKLRSRWHHQVVLDISQEYAGLSPRQQWTNLRDAIDAEKLVEFTFRDDADADADQRFWVRVEVPEGEEESGLDYRGTATLVLREV